MSDSRDSNGDEVLWHTVSVSWHEEDSSGDRCDYVFDARVTQAEAGDLAEALQNPAALVVLVPRRQRAREDPNGFFAVSKRQLTTCEAWPETEEQWTLRQAPPEPAGRRYSRGILGELERELNAQRAAEARKEEQLAGR